MAKKKQWQAPGKNWFGLDPHPTDSMIHWTEKDPVAVAGCLRRAYDHISAAGLEADLKLLLSAKYIEAMSDAAEQEAGACI